MGDHDSLGGQNSLGVHDSLGGHDFYSLIFWSYFDCSIGLEHLAHQCFQLILLFLAMSCLPYKRTGHISIQVLLALYSEFISLLLISLDLSFQHLRIG